MPLPGRTQVQLTKVEVKVILLAMDEFLANNEDELYGDAAEAAREHISIAHERQHGK